MVSKLLKIIHALPMQVTFKHLFIKPITVQYPEERRDLPPRSRGLHAYDAERCLGCGACARACPNNCIELEVSTTPDGKKQIDKFDIYYGRCMFCGLCMDSCIGKGVLSMTTEFEFSDVDRKSLVYTKERIARKKEEGEEEESES
jgi:NADH-quinone oxidoreductase subunit I